jgi:hypothetical protein
MVDKKYTSKYLADSEVTAAQYLCEFIVERIAKKEGATLPVKFWATAKWGKTFVRQIAAANKLLKTHDIRDIIAALNHPKGKWITSLGAVKQIEEIINMKGIIGRAGVEPTSTQHKDDRVSPTYHDESTCFITKEHLEEIPVEKRTKSLWEKLN